MATESIITVYRSTTTDTPAGLTFGELAYSDLNGKFFVGKNNGTPLWVGAGITTGSISNNSATLIPTQSAVKAYVDAASPTNVVTSVNGATGDITNVAKTNVAQTFTAAQSFSVGLTALGATFSDNINVNGVLVGRGASGATSYNIILGGGGFPTLGNRVSARETVVIGDNAFPLLESGAFNVAIGNYAGYEFPVLSVTGGIYIGSYAGPSQQQEMNSIAIGYNTFSDGSNTTVIGNFSTISTRVYGLLSTNGGLSAAGATFSGNVFAPNILNSIAGLTGEVSITGTANEVSVTNNTNTITIGLPDDVVITGNLTVNGTVVTQNVESFIVEDPLIVLGTGNSGDSLDLGFYSKFTSGSLKYAGLFRDASDSGKYKLFTGLTEEPDTTVNTGGAGYAVATLVARIDGGTF